MTTENYENIHNFRQIEVGSFFLKNYHVLLEKKLDLNSHMFDGKFG